LILWDLPWKPSLVEQRIGRLDRIGRQIPVEIVYFKPPAGVGRDVVQLFERLGLFREPMAGVEPQLAPLEAALERIALEPGDATSPEEFDALIADAQAARSRIREAAYQQLHRDPYRADMAAGILARIPPDLDALNEHVVTRVCARLGFGVERPRGRRQYAIEFGNEALVDSLPGVPGGSAFVGTFDREAAVENDLLDFFASGHPLVEGIFAHLDENSLGRVTRFRMEGGGERDEGLIVVYKDGRGFDMLALDRTGRERPDWVAALRRRPLKLHGVGLGDDRKWTETVRRLAEHLDPTRRPHAVAAVVIGPNRE
jgi:ATP-dependent helicase HepA